MTQHLLLPSVSLMSPLAAEVWVNCKCYLYFKGPFALWQKAKVSVYLRLWLVLISRKTKDTSNITHCGISKGRTLWMSVKYCTLYMYVAKESSILSTVFRQQFCELPCASARGMKGICTSLCYRWKWKTESIIPKGTAAASRCSQPGNGKSGHSLCCAQLSWH